MPTVIVGPVTNIPPPSLALSVDAIVNPPLGGIASATRARNVGTGTGQTFRDKTGTTLNLRTLVGGMGVNVVQTNNVIELSAAGGASPWQEMLGVIEQINVASNVVMGATTIIAGEKTRIVGDLRVDSGSILSNAVTATPLNTNLALGGADTAAMTYGNVADSTTHDFLGTGTATFGGAVAGASSGTFPTSVLTASATTPAAATFKVGDTPATKIEFGSIADNPVAEFLGSGDVQLSSQIRFVQRAGDPVAVASSVFGYAKDVSGTAEFFVRTTDGAIQMTNGGTIAGSRDIIIPAVDTDAFRVREAGSGTPWISVDTSGNDVFIGRNSGSSTVQFFVSDNNNAFRVRAVDGAGDWLSLALTGTGLFQVGNGGILNPRAVFQIADGVNESFFVEQGSNDYINVSTVNGSEAIDFGNPTTNPSYEFLGAGGVTINGKLTVVGAIDPPSVSLSGGTALFYESDDGQTAPLSGAATGRLRYNNVTAQWESSVQAGAYAALGGSTTDILITDNVTDAFRVRQAGIDYINIDTTDGSEQMTFGNGITAYLFQGPGVATFNGAIDAAGMTTTTLNTTSSLIVAGGIIDLDPVSAFLLDMDAGSPVTLTISDNLGLAFQVKVGTDNYVVVNSQDAAEEIILGNPITNPEFSLLGTGNLRFDTAGDRLIDIEASGSTLDGSDFVYGAGMSGAAGGAIPGGLAGEASLQAPDGGVGSALAIGGGGGNADVSAGAGGVTGGAGAGPNGSVTIGTKNALSVAIGNGSSSINLGLGSSTIGMFGVVAVSQPVSAGILAGFTMNAGTAVLDDSTFTGGVGASAYTLGDVVRALKDLGAVAL